MTELFQVLHSFFFPTFGLCKFLQELGLITSLTNWTLVKNDFRINHWLQSNIPSITSFENEAPNQLAKPKHD
jgi:hypothetical protein